jgi:hypothetical protein
VNFFVQPDYLIAFYLKSFSLFTFFFKIGILFNYSDSKRYLTDLHMWDGFGLVNFGVVPYAYGVTQEVRLFLDFILLG